MVIRHKPRYDSILCKDQLQALQTMLKAWGASMFMQTMIYILTKKVEDMGKIVEPSRLIPFRLNREQQYVEDNLAQNTIELKGRQIGSTTYYLNRRLFLPAVTEPGVGCLLISQSNEMAQLHFKIVKRSLRYFACEDPFNDEVNDLNKSLKANLLHTQYSNRREILFDYLDSTVIIGSAEVEEAAQGITLHHIVASEYARWPGQPQETLSNVIGALTPDGTRDKESTANMMAGPFFEDFIKAWEHPETSDEKAFFFEWWWGADFKDDLTKKQADELRADLTSEELLIIRKIHKDLQPVAYVG